MQSIIHVETKQQEIQQDPLLQLLTDQIQTIMSPSEGNSIIKFHMYNLVTCIIDDSPETKTLRQNISQLMHRLQQGIWCIYL